MRFNKIILAWATLLAIIAYLISTEVWAKQPEQIIERLDNQYYYPHHHGLNKLAVRIRWEQLDISSETGKFLRNPDVTFHWSSSSGHPGKYFKLSDKTFERSKTRKQELLSILENYKEMIIPLTLQERLSRFKGKVKQTWKNKIQIDFESQDLNDQINKYSFFINLKNWFIRKMKIYQNNGPREVKVELSYIQKEGLWLLFESLTQFKLDGQTFEENTRYFYRRVQSFWLVNKMKQTLKQNDQIVQSYIFRMNNYQLN